MNKINTIILAVIGGCSVLMEIMTPIAIALFWGYFFELNGTVDALILIVGGLGSLFRAIKIGFMK
jgi:hypothetical protein